ncbi:MAG: RsmE family RNA methyltransferase [Myxococcota bacterium]
MSVRAFHPPGPWAAGHRLTLDGEESHYLLRVRRIRPGSALELLDGQAARWHARLVEHKGRRAVVELLQPLGSVTVLPLELLLVMPEPRATLESITHACELGATAIWLVKGDHSAGAVPSPERIAKTIAAAQRQCGRPTPPAVHGPLSLTQALASTAHRPGHVAQIPDRHHATPVLVDPGLGARLLVGPEGGLSPPEQAAAAGAGLRPLSLGPWVLRAPTAVSAGLARLQGATSSSDPLTNEAPSRADP